MRDSKKNKKAGVNSRFASVSASVITRIQEDAVQENAKNNTKFGLKVFKGKKRLTGVRHSSSVRACPRQSHISSI